MHTGHAAATPVSAPSCRFGNVQVPASMANDSADLLCIAPTPSSGAGTVALALALALALGLDGAPEYRGALHACAHYSASPSASTARRSTEARPRACAHYSAVHACAHYSAPEYRGAPNLSYFAPPSVQRIFPSSGSRGGGALHACAHYSASSLRRGAEGAALSCTCMAPRSARRSSRPTPMP